MSAADIVGALQGTNAAARFFGVKPPSVTEWLRNGVIPEDKLVRRAAQLEKELPGRFSRVGQWPEIYQEIWPELQADTAAQEAAIERRVGERRMSDRRAADTPTAHPMSQPAAQEAA